MRARYLAFLAMITIGLLLWGGLQFRSKPPAEPVANSETPVVETSEGPESSPAGPSRPEMNSAAEKKTNSKATGPSEKRIPSDLIRSLQQCFLSAELEKDDSSLEESGRSLSFDEFLAEIEKEWGPALQQGDLWTEWIVRLNGGLDRKIHLENIVSPAGHIHRRLRLSQLDQSGNSQPLKVEGLDEENPGMQVIATLLNEGEVLKKESAKYLQYANGERFEFIEVDSVPVEFEIVRGETFFRCDHLETPQACTCIR